MSSVIFQIYNLSYSQEDITYY